MSLDGALFALIDQANVNDIEESNVFLLWLFHKAYYTPNGERDPMKLAEDSMSCF